MNFFGDLYLRVLFRKLLNLMKYNFYPVNKSVKVKLTADILL